MAGWIFTAYQSVLFCLDETTAHPEHLLFDNLLQKTVISLIFVKIENDLQMEG